MIDRLQSLIRSRIMTSQTLTTLQFLQRQAASLLLYQAVLQEEAGKAFLDLLHILGDESSDSLTCLQAYGRWFRAIASLGQSWQSYLISRILTDDNPFSQQSQRQEFSDLPPALVEAAKQDLQALQSLYECNFDQLREWLKEVAQTSTLPVAWNYLDPTSPHQADLIFSFQQVRNWQNLAGELADYYHQHGTGIFAKYQAFRWISGRLIGIPHPHQIRLEELVGYQSSKKTLIQNTQFLLAGYPALHVLLYGSRGSGKSSLVKALLNEFASQNLRLVEVAKSELTALPEIVEQLRDLPQKFIIFVDDLSFEEDDDAFKSLKVVLEGNITARPQNVVVYATSNRRHLVREYFADRPRPKDADEIQHWDTVQEKLSFSDRFGLTLTFEPADQNTYLEIVYHLAQKAEIQLPQKDLEFRALQWATRHNGRSGRTARQFIDFLQAELANLEN